MAAQFHVNGLASIYVCPDIATSGSWLLLGYSVDGVTINMNYETEDVYTDKWGSKIPEDVLNLGQWAEVKCNLIKYDNAVLEQIQTRLNDALGTYGELPNLNNSAIAIGTLMGQCSHMMGLHIIRGTTCTELGTATAYEGGWQFNASYLADTDSFKVGTIVTEHELTWRCLPDSNGVLFTKDADAD